MSDESLLARVERLERRVEELESGDDLYEDDDYSYGGSYSYGYERGYADAKSSIKVDDLARQARLFRFMLDSFQLLDDHGPRIWRLEFMDLGAGIEDAIMKAEIDNSPKGG